MRSAAYFFVAMSCLAQTRVNSTQVRASQRSLDFSVVRADATTLSVGDNCTLTTPCNARIGSIVTTVSSQSLVRLLPGAPPTGLVDVFVDSTGILTVLSNVPVTCAGICSAQVTNNIGFPVDSIPLYSWSETNGTWDPIGFDFRAQFNTKVVTSGVGLVSTNTGNKTTLSLDTSVVGVRYVSPLNLGPDASKAIPATIHGFNPPCALWVYVYELESQDAFWHPVDVNWTVDPTTCDVNLPFIQPQSNYYVLIK